MTEFHPVTGETVNDFLKMRILPEQEDFVGSNAVTLAQSIFEPGSEVWGIFDGKTPVGMVAMIDMAHPDADLSDGDDPDGIYLWRLLIDKDAQHRGHGRAALDFTVARARALGRAHVALSSVDGPGCAIPFYEAYGFRKTGRIVDDEVCMTLRPLP